MAAMPALQLGCAAAGRCWGRIPSFGTPRGCSGTIGPAALGVPSWTVSGPSDRTAAQQKLPAMGPGAVFIGGRRRRTAVHASKKKPQSNALRLPFARGHLRRVIS